MKLKTPLILSTVSLLALTACVDPNAYPDDPNARTRTGAIMGGLLGAAVAVSGDDADLGDVALGAGAGALVGATIGASLDRQAAELRAELGGNVGVTNTGSSIVVNLPQDLLFATDSAALRPDLAADLRAVSMSLIRYPNSRIEVVGHTDNTGSAAYNYDLSQRRASAVATVLAQNGVPQGRMSVIGRGFDQPVASNATAAGKAANRRVEIIIVPVQ